MRRAAEISPRFQIIPAGDSSIFLPITAAPIRNDQIMAFHYPSIPGWIAYSQLQNPSFRNYGIPPNGGRVETERKDQRGITATDPAGLSAFSDLNILLGYPPIPISEPLILPLVLDVGPFEFALPQNLFISQYPISYRIGQIPPWLEVVSVDSLTFKGTAPPSALGFTNVTVFATDIYGSSASGSFSLLIDNFPINVSRIF